MKKMHVLLIAYLAATLVGCAPQDDFKKPGTSHKPATPVNPNPPAIVTNLVNTIDGKELNAFGVNFQTPISWEANRLNKAGISKSAEELNKVTDNNIDDVVLMGAKQLRCHLTPADFTDAQGNLVENMYLDALDYMVYKAKEKGLLVSFAFLNHMGQKGPGADWAGKGAETWIHDPEVVSCTSNYISGLLLHKNKYSGEMYKDMTHLSYWELINEPDMYSYSEIKNTEYNDLYQTWLNEKGKNDTSKSYGEYRTELVKSYIDHMHDLIRSKGDRHPICWGLNWHRYRKDNADIFEGVAASKAEIVAFCNYPGQDYVSQDYYNKTYNFTDRSFSEWFNKYYTNKDGYGWAISDDFIRKAKIVYEFETFFNQSAYIYPIQALYFRALGAQAANMWTYTFNEIAPYFGGSHFLNLRYTPSKAASFIVAEKIFSSTATGIQFTVADEMKGENWCVSKSRDAAVYSDSEWYCHSGATDSGWSKLTPSEGVKHIRGIGNSPLAKYSGNGIYFIDETDKGLEILLMPNIEIKGDRFASTEYKTEVTKLIYDKVNTLSIYLKNWKESECSLYDISGEKQVLLNDNIKGSSTMSLKPGKYLLVKNIK